jgi:phage terminase Nu1 subunit (DNA packaging protein)
LDVNILADSIVSGITAVAEHFNRSDRQIRRWLRDGMPRLSQDRFDVLQIASWLESRRKMRRPAIHPGWTDPRQQALGDAVEPVGKDYHDERLKKAKADMAEMEVKQRRAELIAKRDIEQLWAERASAAKQNLLTFSRSLPPQLIHCTSEREMEIVILSAVRELLLAFCRPQPEALGGIETPPELLAGLVQ